MTKEQIITTAVALAAAVLIFTIILMIRRAVRHRKLSIDDMEGHEFEAFCAQMLALDGFDEVITTKASRDFGADILASRDGVTYAIQF